MKKKITRKNEINQPSIESQYVVDAKMIDEIIGCFCDFMSKIHSRKIKRGIKAAKLRKLATV